ncbi:hypothetical protein CDB3_32100 [Bacillus sp. CDB3]|nr:hypothetical protein CDB3_32100 [Bacillus sp. CDB3]
MRWLRCPLSGGSTFVWSNGSGTVGEHKELTTPQAQYPLVPSKTAVLGVPTGEGVPFLIKGGWGIRKE